MWWTPQTSSPCNSPGSWMAKKLESTVKDGFDFGDEDEQRKLEELDADVHVPQIDGGRRVSFRSRDKYPW